MVHIEHIVIRRIQLDLQLWVHSCQLGCGCCHRHDTTVDDGAMGIDDDVSLEDLRETFYHATGYVTELFLSE